MSKDLKKTIGEIEHLIFAIGFKYILETMPSVNDSEALKLEDFIQKQLEIKFPDSKINSKIKVVEEQFVAQVQIEYA